MKSDTKYLTMQLGNDLDAETSADNDSISFAGAAPASPTRNHGDPLVKRGQPKTDTRTVHLVDPTQLGTTDDFMGNRVSTGKYNLVTFLPKFLVNEFSRTGNLFFLFISIIQQIPGVSPTGRYTTIMPLMMVLGIQACKELLEDFKRHQEDAKVNRRFVKVFREGTFQTVRWNEVKCGDFVKVLDGQFFPADLIILSSSEPGAMCYIETANLDGETNLKIRQGLKETMHITSTREVRAFKGAIECESPNNRLYTFVGNVAFSSSKSSTKQRTPLSADQLLLRGAQLRNTPWVYGAVVYTGHETKLMQNAAAAPNKWSNVFKIMNYQQIGLLGVLLFLALVTLIGNQVWLSDPNHEDAWYLDMKGGAAQPGFYNFLTYIILYNMLIPISLVVTLEVVKLAQAQMFINNDLDLYDKGSDTPARAISSTLNEELGQVQYIFSDKTGTLTRNIMMFLKCSIGGIAYGDDVQQTEGDNDDFSDPALLDNLTGGHPTASIIREWLTLLAVCHTVVPERDEVDKDKIVYQASSPDENALVVAVKKLGFSFNARTPEMVFINALGKEERYEILNVLEFNSTRKRMSVIVRTPSGAIKLYCKGADNVIYDRLDKRKQPFAKDTTKHLQRFAADGLRTLCLSVAQLTEAEYKEWLVVYNEAATAIVDRGEKVDAACELIEKNMFLLGATAIEDKLQVGVPETIRNLANAGIKIWVLTGDKQETAINIGYSCKLLTQAMKLLICNEDSEQGVRRWLSDTCRENGFGDAVELDEHLALIVDGPSLLHALNDNIKEQWLSVARRCKAVICCRVSPKQKADIVRLVQQSVSAITLAIGDGANDVGMIQAAHVGVGISGEEGLQAARAADYAIAQFRFLEKLLLVHGSWSYRRITILVLYYFYKNFSLSVIELYYAFSNGFSGQILFEEWMISGFNIFFTLLPPFIIGIFEQHADAESLLKVPTLYKVGQDGTLFNTRQFWLWNTNAAYHCTLVYFCMFSIYDSEVPLANGKTADHWVVGTATYGMLVYVALLKAALIMKHWVVYTHISIWGSLAAYFVFTLIYCSLDRWSDSPTLAHKVLGVDMQLYSSGLFWFASFVIPVAVLFVDYVIQAFQFNFRPTLTDCVRSQEKKPGGIQPTTFNNPAAEIGAIASADVSPKRHTGYAFSQADSRDESKTESNLPTQAELIRKYDTNVSKPQGE